MQLSFTNQHLSITDFETVEIPDFTIITGPNGVGKTHLLKAIQLGQIRNDLVPTNTGSIQFVDNATNVDDAETFQQKILEHERSQTAQAFQQLSNNSIGLQNGIRSFCAQLRIETTAKSNLSEVINDAEEVINKLESNQRSFALDRLRELKSELIRNVILNFNAFPAALPRVQKAALRLGVPLYELSAADVELEEDWGHVEFLGQSFSRLFLAYHQRWMANRFNRFLTSEGEAVGFLTDAQFKSRYGPAPWDLVNNSLAEFNSDLEVISPTGYPLPAFAAFLRKKSTQRILNYSSLSSGERVFFALFVSAYKSIDTRQETILPKLLLLDEVEATLHPSMIRRFLATVKKTFVNKMGMHVILTTHSPTTVALADEESVFVMDAQPRRLRKVGKNQAIAELTIGVPFLSLSYDGRRQVMVEAPSDAKIYARLYSILRSRLQAERSLEFIPVGNGAEGSGCAQVRSVVGQLTEAGNSTVFGLLDWDGENAPTDRIKVLAFGRRDGLENVLLDPFLIACLIVRDARYHLEDLELTADASLRTLAATSFADAQRLASKVEDLVLGEAADSERVECCYQGGLRIYLRRAYLEHDDHGLEEKIRARFATFNEVKRRSGSLGMRIADTVLNDYSELIPDEIAEAFQTILQT